MPIETDAGNIKLLGGWLCLDFANTVDWRGRDNPHEWLNGYEDLVLWSRHLKLLSELEYEALHQEARRSPEQTEEVYRKAMALREAIYHIFSTIAEGGEPETDDIYILNEELSITFNHLKLRRSENGFRLELERNGTVIDQMLWPIAQSASDLLVSNKLNRVRRCAAEECGWLFLDMSRNRSRRWCNMKDCGNRTKARRYYQRKREAVV